MDEENEKIIVKNNSKKRIGRILINLINATVYLIPFHNCHPGIKIFVRNVDKDTIHRIYIYISIFFNLKRKKNERESNREKERRNWIFFFFK